MKKILYCAIALVSFVLHSCTKDIEEQNRGTNEGISRILVQAPESQSTKVAINGHVVTWAENDNIYLHKLGFTAGGSTSPITFRIDPKTISKDGKSAEFIISSSWEGLVDGAKYIALTRENISYSDRNAIWFSISNYGEVTQSGSGDNSHIADNLFMSSQVFTAQSDQVPTLYFEIEQSVVELDLKFKSSVVEEYEIESVTLSPDGSTFTNYIGLYADGFVGIKDGDESYDTPNDQVVVKLSRNTIGQDIYKVFIPTFWNELRDATGNFTISIKTTDNKYSTAEFPAKELLNGTIYTKTIEFDTPEDSSEADKRILLEIYNAWGGNKWVDYNGDPMNWNLNKPLNEWSKVTTNLSGRLSGLDLGELKITSELTSKIVNKFAQLSELESLELYRNSITGSIPSNISLLKNLKKLSLSNNKITGSIPASIGSLTKLEELDFSELELSGSIPSEIYNLTNLRSLSIGGANLTGTISDKIGNLVNLRGFGIINAGIGGTLPSTLGNLINLEELVIAYTNIEGAIPATVSKLTKLQYVFLVKNRLSGSIPISLLNNKNIDELNLLFNNFTSSGNEHLFADQAVWNRCAMYILTQNAGYGFDNRFKNVYAESVDLTLQDKTVINTFDYFAKNEYTCLASYNSYSNDGEYNALSNTAQLAYSAYENVGLGLLTGIDNFSNVNDYILEHQLNGDFYDRYNDFMDNWDLSNLHVVVDKNGKIVSSPLIDGYLTIEQVMGMMDDDSGYESSDKLLEFLAETFGDMSPYLSVSSASLEMQSSGGKVTLKVASNSSWGVSKSASWIKLSTTSGSNNADCVITFTKNTGNAPRNGTITFTGAGTTINVNVMQKMSMLDDLIDQEL